MKTFKIFGNSLVLTLLFAGTSSLAQTKYVSQGITFYRVQPLEKGSIEPYRGKVDLSKVEHDLPVSQAALAKLNLAALATMTEEELDQLYARLSSGPIPDGAFEGQVMPGVGGGLKAMSANIKELSILKNFDKVAGLLWKGKHFYRDEMILRNNIDGKMKFPAKLYCGQSLLDSRRESIIIDYAYSDDIAGYTSILDPLATRQGLAIRDEIRMVRPGLYLGRAYAERVFLLDFALESPQYAKTGNSVDDCWAGHQARGFTR